MGRRVWGSVVGALALIGVGFGSAAGAPGGATGGFTCATDIGAHPASLAPPVILGIAWTASTSCNTVMATISMSSLMAGSTGPVERSGTTSGCGSCSGAITSGAVPLVVPGSEHHLVVTQTEVAPCGEVWGSLDAGPYGSCTGVGTTTARCVWNVPISQAVGPLAAVGMQPMETAVANASQSLIDQAGGG